MNAEILCVGTEILLGDITNTNATYISRALAAKGINVFHHSVVGDNPARLEESFTLAASRSDLVVTTGGLGPTYDDLTKEIIAAHFGRKLKLHEPSLEAMQRYFSKGSMKMTQNNVKQAMLPEGCIVMPNHNGTAPGMIIEDWGPGDAGNGGADGMRNPDAGVGSELRIPRKIAILLPGPPRELRSMWEECVDPYLDRLSKETIVSHTIKVFGLGESSMESMLHDYLVEHTNPTAAPYAKDGECLLRVTAKAPTKEAAEEMLKPMMQELCERLGSYVYGVDVPDIQTVLVRTLKEKGLTAATAESFTGGYVAKRITDVSGASSVLHYGAVTYANEVKHAVLGVREETLEQFGAVSKETAREMAEGIRRVSGADIGIATTGVAGPEPSEGKPVGTAFVAVSYAGSLPKGDGTEAAAGALTGSTVWPPSKNAFCYEAEGVVTVVRELTLGRGRVDDRELIRFMGASHAMIMAIRAAEQL